MASTIKKLTIGGFKSIRMRLHSPFGEPHLSSQFHRVRNDVPTPEDINNDPDTAPSKRVLGIYSTYRKVIEGTLATRAVGIQKMRKECAHFCGWLERLEALPDL